MWDKNGSNIKSWNCPDDKNEVFEIAYFDDFLIMFKKSDKVVKIEIFDVYNNKQVGTFSIDYFAFDYEFVIYAHGHLFIPNKASQRIHVLDIGKAEISPQSKYDLELSIDFYCEKLNSLTFHNGQLIAVNELGNLCIWDWNNRDRQSRVFDKIPLELILSCLNLN